MSMHDAIVSVVIVHYCANDLILKSIGSIEKCTPSDYTIEVVVVDNSHDFVYPSTASNIIVKCYRMGYNSGFARAVNLGLTNCTGKFVMLLNQDTQILSDDIFSRMIKVVTSSSDNLIVGCRMLNSIGGYQQSIWSDFPSLLSLYENSAINFKINPLWKKAHIQKTEKLHVHSGFVLRMNAACVFFSRPEDVVSMKFDEDYFLYGEDVEWAYRMRKQGFLFYYLHDVSIEHIGSASSPDIEKKMYQIKISEWLTVKKIHGKCYLMAYVILELVVVLMDLLLAILFCVRNIKFGSRHLDQQRIRVRAQIMLMRNYFGIVLLRSKLSAVENQFVKFYDYDTSNS